MTLRASNWTSDTCVGAPVAANKTRRIKWTAANRYFKVAHLLRLRAAKLIVHRFARQLNRVLIHTSGGSIWLAGQSARKLQREFGAHTNPTQLAPSSAQPNSARTGAHTGSAHACQSGHVRRRRQMSRRRLSPPETRPRHKCQPPTASFRFRRLAASLFARAPAPLMRLIKKCLCSHCACHARRVAGPTRTGAKRPNCLPTNETIFNSPSPAVPYVIVCSLPRCVPVCARRAFAP